MLVGDDDVDAGLVLMLLGRRLDTPAPGKVQCWAKRVIKVMGVKIVCEWSGSIGAPILRTLSLKFSISAMTHCTHTEVCIL